MIHEFMSSVSPGVSPGQDQVDHTVNVVGQPTKEECGDQSNCKKMKAGLSNNLVSNVLLLTLHAHGNVPIFILLF